MSTAAIYDLFLDVGRFNGHSPEYVDKMFHDVPPVPTVDRAEYVKEAVAGKSVLDIGCTGPLADLIRAEAGQYVGVDMEPPTGDEYYRLDLDRASELPPGEYDWIVAGEVIEHLSNPGHFLDLLLDVGCPVILTTPNPFGKAGLHWWKKGVEHVSKEHTCWFSWHTFSVLAERHGFRIVEWCWYNGDPLHAEGMIFNLEPDYA